MPPTSKQPATNPKSKGSSSSQSRRSDESNRSVKSTGSGGSGGSGGSSDSQKTHSSGISELTAVTRVISEDFHLAAEELQYQQDNKFIKELEDYLSSKRGAWSSEMKEKHAKYHVYGDDRIKLKGKFNKASKDPKVTFDQRRKLAIAWADMALVEAEARLQFMNDYPHSYKGAEGARTHLIAANDVMNSAQKALEAAKNARDDREKDKKKKK